MRTKKHRRALARHTSAPAYAAAAPAGQPSAYFSGYQAASFTGDRGAIFWPTIDTRQELDSFSRLEIIRRIHWLKAHFGFVRGLIKNSADLVGWQTPQAQSGDAAWDDLAEAAFRDVTGEAAAFDVAAKFDFDSAQPMLMRAALTDAHIFTVLTKWPDGAARVAFYEAAQLASPNGAGAEWVDGIKVSRTGRHLAYGFRDRSRDTVVVIPARDVIYFGEFDSPGQDMPVPPLAHAVNHAIDITEVWGFTKKGIKISSLSGAVIERDSAAIPPRGKMGMPGAMATATNTATGEKFQQSNVWDGGQIQSLEPGSKMKILTDARPPREQRDFTADLKRDIAQGFGLPIEVVDDMGNLTGPGIRFVMDFAGNWIRCRQKRLKIWARQVWRYVIACEIAAGRLPLPAPDATGKQKWWAVTFTSQRLLTIDRGKESRARLDELSAGVSTLADWEEFDGRDWKDRGLQRIREVQFLKEQCEAADLDYHEVFPPRPGTAAAVGGAGVSPASSPADDDDEEDDAPPASSSSS